MAYRRGRYGGRRFNGRRPFKKGRRPFRRKGNGSSTSLSRIERELRQLKRDLAPMIDRQKSYNSPLMRKLRVERQKVIHESRFSLLKRR